MSAFKISRFQGTRKIGAVISMITLLSLGEVAPSLGQQVTVIPGDRYQDEDLQNLANLLEMINESWSIKGDLEIRIINGQVVASRVNADVEFKRVHSIDNTIYFNTGDNGKISEVYLPGSITGNPRSGIAVFLTKGTPRDHDRYVRPVTLPETGIIEMGEGGSWVTIPKDASDNSLKLFRVKTTRSSPDLSKDYFVKPADQLALGVYFADDAKAWQVKLPSLDRQALIGRSFSLVDIPMDETYSNIPGYFYRIAGNKTIASFAIDYRENQNSINSIDVGDMDEFKDNYLKMQQMNRKAGENPFNMVVRAQIVPNPSAPLRKQIFISENIPPNTREITGLDNIQGIKPAKFLDRKIGRSNNVRLPGSLFTLPAEITWEEANRDEVYTFQASQVDQMVIHRFNKDQVGLPPIWWATLGFASSALLFILVL